MGWRGIKSRRRERRAAEKAVKMQQNIDAASRNVESWMEKIGSEREHQVEMGRLGFADAQVKGVTSEDTIAELTDKGIDNLSKSLEIMGSMSNESITTVGGAMQRRNAQRESLRRARKAAKLGKELMGRDFDPRVAFKSTGYKAVDKGADFYYNEFDQDLQQQREAVASEYGVDYSSLSTEYGDDLSQKDIDNIVFERMTGVDATTMRQTNQYGQQDYTGQFMDIMRQYYTESQLAANQGLAALSDVENMQRAEQAKSMEAMNREAFAQRKQSAELAGAEAERAIVQSERSVDAAYEQSLSQLSQGSPLKKKKVRSVDFGADRAL